MNYNLSKTFKKKVFSKKKNILRKKNLTNNMGTNFGKNIKLKIIFKKTI